MGRPQRQAAVVAKAQTAADLGSGSGSDSDDFEEPMRTPPPRTRLTPKRAAATSAQKSVLDMLRGQNKKVEGDPVPVAGGCVGWDVAYKADKDDEKAAEGHVCKYDGKKKLHLVRPASGGKEEWLDLASVASVEWKNLLPVGAECVGRRVGIWWGGDDVFYYGEVKEHRAKDGHHLVEYDDEEEDWLDLQSEKVTWPKSPEDEPETPEATPSPKKASKKPAAKAGSAKKTSKKSKADDDSEDFELSDASEEESEEESDASEIDEDGESEEERPKPKSVSRGAGKKQARPAARKAPARAESLSPEEKPKKRNRPPKTYSSEAARARAQKRKAPKPDPVNPDDLPVINEPHRMFEDLVSRTPDLAKFAKTLKRPLRVATMCSGTESPLLALDMICRNLKEQHGVELEVEHVFSCEIEPFKQAYIERNFQPPILFRDIRELGGDRATTAYGSLVDVPGNIDLLVAGTSCVDYSNLNTQKKDLDDKGESGQTFRGMMKWIDKHKPPLIILENVCSAPWPRVAEKFEDHGYNADFMRVDTKQYYIPHTRTRVYLMATLHKDPGAPGKWYDMVQSLERPASSTLEAFLLPTDDPRVHSARERLARPGGNRGSSGVDWNRCESRHQRARLEELLGSKRPFTSWEEGAACKMPDYAWNDWATSQTDRVLDLMDINTLRLAVKGTDPTYKTLVWNLSQNVDRETGSSRPGICPCLTPSMVPFVTNRGGPLVGIEALSLQGIPVNDLLLTRESEDNMADLAGNAMTTTVVGACIMAALCVAGDAIPEVAWEEEMVQAYKGKKAEEAGADVAVVGEDALGEKPLPLGEDSSSGLPTLLRDAQRSARLCFCEGQESMAKSVRECGACGHTACQSCGGRPEHAFADFKDARLSPHEFGPEFKAALPMWIQLSGFSPSHVDKLKPPGADAKLWAAWAERVGSLEGADFCFRGLNRAAVWTATFAAPGATLELILDPKCPEWLASVDPPAESGKLRDVLSHPVARMRVSKEDGVSKGAGLLAGEWEVKLPIDHSFKVTVEGKGEQVDTWEGSLGLKGTHEGKKRWTEWEVSVDAADAALLDDDISGRYKLLERCGAAQASLHKSGQAAAGGDRDRPLYLFLDPMRAAKPEFDPFVFAHAHRRLAFTERRDCVARLEPKWRPGSGDGKAKVSCHAAGRWARAPAASATPNAAGGARVAEAEGAAPLKVSDESCEEAVAVLRCKVPLQDGHEQAGATAGSITWPSGHWERINLDRSKATFDRLAWFTERVQLPAGLSTWVAAELQGDHLKCAEGSCPRCAPPRPELQWVKASNGPKIEPRENALQAAEYEQALKRRPKPFLVELRKDGECGTMRVAVNASSLMHRALAALPKDSLGTSRVSWRVVGHVEAGHVSTFEPLKLRSNRHDKPHPQPPHFSKHPLRPEQLRSLGWMLDQEATAEHFVEEEVEESVLPGLKWRAEGRAERDVLIRGGVLADQVGYGKTAITLALIDTAPRIPDPEGPALRGRIPVKATLVLAPPHLLKQWPHEVTKFTGRALKVVVVNTAGDISRLTLKEVQEADVIVAATSVLRSDVYFDRLAQLAGSKRLSQSKNGGRHFNATYDEAMKKLEDRLSDLTSHKDGAKRMADAMRTGTHAVDAGTAADGADLAELAPKRLKGKALIEATERAERLAADKAKKEGGGKGSRSPRENDGAAANGADHMDEDEDEEGEQEEEEEEKAAAPPPSKKSKTAAGGAKGKAAGADVWGFKDRNVQKNWSNMKAPPFEIFHFQRVVVDEFTYLTGRDRKAVLGLRASARWCLSGTPPVEGFGDVKGIAQFLGANLGVDEAPPVAKREQTKAETFQYYREVHTNAWHARRHRLAQGFLDRFLRQNIAEIDEILAEQHIERVSLLPAERAIYLELEHHLQAMDMKAKKKVRKGQGGDREARLRQVLGASGSAEEALLKRCAHFDIAGQSTSALQTCQDIVDLRREQLDECKADVVASVRQAHGMLKVIRGKEPGYDPKGTEDPFLRWTRDVKTGAEGSDDSDASDLLKTLVDEGNDGAGGKKAAAAGDGKKVSADDLKWELREHTHLLRRLQKELVGRVRSLRYFRAVRDLQKEVIDRSCPGCGKKDVSVEEHAVLSCCGHTGCRTCLFEYADKQECPQPGCKAAARISSVIQSTALGRDSARFGGGKFGSKLLDIVKCIQNVPKTERVLVFVQFPDLMQVVASALEDANIKVLQLKGSVYTKTSALEEMQKEDEDRGPNDARVLMLNIKDESASGANLTTANHAIFVHPLLSVTQQEYTACETQAFGRVRRYGQTRKVHLYRFLVDDTMDTEIYKDRVKDDVIPVVTIRRGGLDITNGEEEEGEGGEGANGAAKATPSKTKKGAAAAAAAAAAASATPSKPPKAATPTRKGASTPKSAKTPARKGKAEAEAEAEEEEEEEGEEAKETPGRGSKRKAAPTPSPSSRARARR